MADAPPPLSDADLARMRADAWRLTAARAALDWANIDGKAAGAFLGRCIGSRAEDDILALLAEVERLRAKSPPPRGLKDHEIAKLVNDLRDALEQKLPKYGALRNEIASVVLRSLTEQGLRIPGREG